MIPGDALEYLAQELLETSSKRDSTHRVQQEIDAKIRIVEQHEKLLQAPKQRGGIFTR